MYWQNVCKLTATKHTYYVLKQVVLTGTGGKGVLSIELLQDVHTLAPCSDEEVDDTGVVVLAVFDISQLPAGCELWIAFRSGKSFRCLATHQIAADQRCHVPFQCAMP